jgi:hypothetical protein
MAREEIKLDGGVWSVEVIADDSCYIRDQHGERIHASYRHQSTAIHLATALSDIREMQREIEDWKGFH